jgi:hypothetical protein
MHSLSFFFKKEGKKKSWIKAWGHCGFVCLFAEENAIWIHGFSFTPGVLFFFLSALFLDTILYHLLFGGQEYTLKERKKTVLLPPCLLRIRATFFRR